jgi:iron-only hydrogenase group A
MKFLIEVNSTPIEVEEGQTLLSALREYGFKVPTLCHMSQFSPTGACRLCVVEVEGKRDLITSCSYPVEAQMKVKTNSQRVIKARKSLVELLLSNHPDDCLYCVRNGNCELQWLAEDLNVKERKYFGPKNMNFPDNSSASVFRDPAKCVLCSRCVRVCEELQLVTAIDFISRGTQTTINSAFNKGLNVSSCISCGLCITVCPTAALVDISHIEKVQAALENKNKQVAFFISPSVIASLGEFFDIKPVADIGRKIAAALKKAGVHKVFDGGFAYDVNIIEETTLLLNHINENKNFPLISSNCPAWINYVEEFREDLIPYLSTVKSPQQILGSCLKNYYAKRNRMKPEDIFAVSVTSCVGNKFEASREEMTHKGISEVDAVLTVREFLRLLRTLGLDIRSIEPQDFDEPFNQSTAAGYQMCYSGGKAEAVAYEAFSRLNTNSLEKFRFNLPKINKNKRESKVKVNDTTIGFAWVGGIVQAEEYVNQLQKDAANEIHYLEVMACPGGCVAGGGQPVHHDTNKYNNRKKTCQELEKTCSLGRAGENPLLKAFFASTFNSDPIPIVSGLSIHTGFNKRIVLK